MPTFLAILILDSFFSPLYTVIQQIGIVKLKHNSINRVSDQKPDVSVTKPLNFFICVFAVFQSLYTRLNFHCQKMI